MKHSEQLISLYSRSQSIHIMCISAIVFWIMRAIALYSKSHRIYVLVPTLMLPEVKPFNGASLLFNFQWVFSRWYIEKKKPIFFLVR